MAANPFYSSRNVLDPEEQQLANRAFLHDREQTAQGRRELEKLTYNSRRFSHPALKTRLGPIDLENPLMVAAGWDKFGEAVQGLHLLGFAAIEVGTVPLHAQPGNPKPRHFILGQGVTLNRYGYNSPGAATVHENLQRYETSRVPIGINVGKNKDISLEQAPQHHAEIIKILYSHAAYFTLGVSSPNTADVRSQQAKNVLRQIVTAAQDAVSQQDEQKPVFVKVAPDLSLPELADVVEVIDEANLAGIIVANSSSSESLKAKYGEQWRHEAGGFSGDDEDYRALTTGLIRFVYRETKGAMPIIGVGGITDAASAIEKIRAGASALQIMTAINFEGPQLPGQINSGLVDYLKKEGLESINELVGTL